MARLALIIAACAGCRGGDDCGGPAVEIGTGALEWQSLPAGSELVMVHGPQGGWHMLASGRITGMGAGIGIDYTIRTEDDVVVSDNHYDVWSEPVDACTSEMIGMYGFLDVSTLTEGEADTPPELLAGEVLTLALLVADAEGAQASAEVEVVASVDPLDDSTP